MTDAIRYTTARGRRIASLMGGGHACKSRMMYAQPTHTPRRDGEDAVRTMFEEN